MPIGDSSQEFAILIHFATSLQGSGRENDSY